MPLIPDRLWVQMTAEEQKEITEYIDGFRHSPRIVCPHCGGGVAIKLKLKVTAGATRIDTDTGERDKGAQSTPPRYATGPAIEVLGAKDRAFVAAARESGLLQAFYAAVKTE